MVPFGMLGTLGMVRYTLEDIYLKMTPFDMLLVCYSNFVPKMCHFFNIGLQECCDLEIRVTGYSRSLKVIPFHRLGCLGTGIRGLLRGMETLPQGNQELLVVRDIVGRPPGELGVGK